MKVDEGGLADDVAHAVPARFHFHFVDVYRQHIAGVQNPVAHLTPTMQHMLEIYFEGGSSPRVPIGALHFHW
jgi:hypothetical protein